MIARRRKDGDNGLPLCLQPLTAPDKVELVGVEKKLVASFAFYSVLVAVAAFWSGKNVGAAQFGHAQVRGSSDTEL